MVVKDEREWGMSFPGGLDSVGFSKCKGDCKTMRGRDISGSQAGLPVIYKWAKKKGNFCLGRIQKHGKPKSRGGIQRLEEISRCRMFDLARR